MDPSSSDPKRIERVDVACVQCRSRHVKCDATQPICNRCKRDGKGCIYQKSRRGGLDKAALARRRLRLQQEAERAQQAQNAQHVNDSYESHSSTGSSPLRDQPLSGSLSGTLAIDTLRISEPQLPQASPLVFQVSDDRLLELYFEYFWPSFPLVLPIHYLQARRLNNNHGMNQLLLVLHWIGSIYAPWTSPAPYYEAAFSALSSATLAHTPFNVQALMLFGIAQFHCDNRLEARNTFNKAVAIALELLMNEKSFAQAYGEADLVLEESWRRTYYLLNVADQHFAIVSNTPVYTLLTVPNGVDLPCDDEYYKSGQIPPVMSWSEYENREFAENEVIYSSIVYLYDMSMIVRHILKIFLETGGFGEAIIDCNDTKIAIWSTLLPACKKDPLQRDGRVDEVMFMAHMIAAMTTSAVHRPCSLLSYSPTELSTQSFSSPSPFVFPSKAGRTAHTARVLKALEMHTKLLAIPCVIEKHNLFTMCITAQFAAVQISACTNLLEDHASSIARDRIRLSIGLLNALGSYWPLGKKMAKEVRVIARSSLTSVQNFVATDAGPAAEINPLFHSPTWAVDPSAQIDIYSGIVIPTVWDTTNFGYSSSPWCSLD